jgi:hypothetical protein
LNEEIIERIKASSGKAVSRSRKAQKLRSHTSVLKKALPRIELLKKKHIAKKGKIAPQF